MPITPYLKGPYYYFDLETRRALGIALEMACIALSTGDDDDHVRRTIADKLIALAKAGERNPDVLCDKAPDWPPLSGPGGMLVYGWRLRQRGRRSRST